MVRAPACHVGSCGFKSRLSRSILLLTLTFTFVSCGNSSLEDFREDGRAITQNLTHELQEIHSREELIASSNRLKSMFNQLVDAIIAAREYQKNHPEAEEMELTAFDHQQSEKLRAELNRIYRIEGARELIEKYQEDALNKLSKELK